MIRHLFSEPTTDPASGWATFEDLEQADNVSVTAADVAANLDVLGFAEFYADERHPWVTPAPAEAVA